jgi:chromosome segregation protein
MKTAKQEIEELTIKLERTTVQVSKGGEEVTALSSEREKLDSKMNALRLKRKEFAEAKLVASEDGQRLRITRARLEADFDNLKSEFSNYQKVKPEYKDMGASELEKEVRETMIEINSLGAINMKAIEEFDTVKVGYQELKSRLDTLTAERDRVVSMITEIEGKRLNSFTTTLNAVAEQFRTVYSDLTGGRADLRLEELDSIESGLLIEASPPGRKVLNIDAMSGGEKTLTALAFLFAIQKFRPAPFYILDEIDAALDKPNTKKIAELLKKYRTNAQFIVISHNDTMIQAADCVYGVSMEEGESKLVGIRMPTQ